MATYNPTSSSTIIGNTKLFVFAATGSTNCNFVDTMNWNPVSGGLTTGYVNAGGFVVGTTGELVQYLGNNAHLSYIKRIKSTRSELLAVGGITSTGEDIVEDPRIEIGIVCDGTAGSFTGEFMDEIHITSTSGATFQSFLGRMTYSTGNTLLPEDTVLLGLLGVGISGSDTPLTSISTGATVANKNNGITTSINQSNIRFYIGLQDIQDKIKSQIDYTIGVTGITIGDTTHLRHVVISPQDKDFREFLQLMLPYVRSNAITGDASRQGSIYVPYGFSGTTLGFSLNSITGGTVSGTSLFEEFAVRSINKGIESESSRKNSIFSIDNAKTIRGILTLGSFSDMESDPGLEGI